MKKLLIIILALALLIPLIGCGEEVEATLTEWEAGGVVVLHLKDLATTYEAKQVYAALIDISSSTEDFREDSYTGNGWIVSVFWHAQNIVGNPLLSSVLTDFWPKGTVVTITEQRAETEWRISPEREVEPLNGNAVRLEAALTR